jgi:hypothetical protein
MKKRFVFFLAHCSNLRLPLIRAWGNMTRIRYVLVCRIRIPHQTSPQSIGEQINRRESDPWTETYFLVLRCSPAHTTVSASASAVNVICRFSDNLAIYRTSVLRTRSVPVVDGWPLLSDEWLTTGVGLTLGSVHRFRLRPSSCCCRWRTGAKGLQPWGASGRWRDK